MQIDRILFIINQLSLGPETIHSLHVKLGQSGYTVSQRTVYRDMLKLEEAFRLGNIKLRRYTGEYNKATWVIVAEGKDSVFRKDLYFQTFLSENFKPAWLKAFSGNAIEDVFGAANGMSERDALALQQDISQFCIENSNWGEFIYNHEHYNRLKDFIWAISNQRIVYVAFYDHTAEVEIKFRPLKIILHRGTVHVAGWMFKGDDVSLQVQELDGMRITRLTNERFQRSDEKETFRAAMNDRFGIHDHIGGEKHTIVLEMKEGPAIFLKNRHWHPTQKFRKEGDSWFMEFSCTLNIELLGWLLSWLEHVKVVSPAFLGEMLAERAGYITAMYKEGYPEVAPVNTDNPYLVGK